MKRSWIGFFLLVLLLVGSSLSAGYMAKNHAPIETDLLQAAQRAMEGNWEQADRLFLDAEEAWKRSGHLRSCFADHTPVEQIDADFALLKVFCGARETVSFSGGCLQLARQVAAVGEAHEMVWWNLI